MRISKNRILDFLTKCQIEKGGYAGGDVADTYNLADARASLSPVFTYTDLKTFGGIDIDGIASRLQEAQKWFQQIYPGADPFEWFPRIRLRSKVIRNHLGRIKANESLADQALLIFEAQVDFIQRYLSDATLDLEFRHLWKVYEDLTGHKTPPIIIDPVGIDSRRKSLFAKIHGRYRTIGFADVSASSLYLIPVFSSNCSSLDSVAMKLKLQIDKSVWSGLWSVVLRG